MSQRYGSPSTTAKLCRGLSMPMIVAPMFLVSGPDLVTACCSAGVIGSLPALNARSTAVLDEWLDQIGQALRYVPAAAPYAVNMIVHSTNSRVDADLDLCVKHQVPIIISSVGSPRRVIERAHGYGGLVLSDAGTVDHARRAAQAGVDGIILLCAGAGGNTGALSPFGFVSDVRRFFDGPLILAGAISRGRYVHAAQVIGADMALSGTTFIAATESMAEGAYREMLIRSNADDIILTSELTGIPANMLRESLEKSNFTGIKGLKGFNLDHEISVLKAWKDIWSAGHGVGDIEAVETTQQIVDRFVADYSEACGSERVTNV